eukprot:558454-Amphidinium_carterae.1
MPPVTHLMRFSPPEQHSISSCAWPSETLMSLKGCSFQTLNAACSTSHSACLSDTVGGAAPV